MYAKLVFNSGTTAGEAVRDIARLIDDSSSGSASLSNLEFTNTSSSELVAGTNSGWSLHSSTSLGSGTVSATDSKYILEGTTATGSKSKYCGIQVNGNWTSSGIYGGTSVGVLLSNVLDPGNSTREFWSTGSTSSSTSTAAYHGLAPTTIYVFAEPRKILIFGTTLLTSIPICNAQLECAETPNTTYRSLPPTMYVQWGKTTQATTSYQTYTNAKRGDNFWAQNVFQDSSLVQFSGSMYSDNPNMTGTIRSWGCHCSNYRGYDNYISAWAGFGNTLMDDGSTANGTANNSSYLGQSGQEHAMPNIRWEIWGPGATHAGSSSNTNYYKDGAWGYAGMSTRDSSGNKALPLRPIVFDWPKFSADIYNASDVSKIWWAPTGLGATGDTVTVGSDVYVYLLLNSGPGGAVLVKRI